MQRRERELAASIEESRRTVAAMAEELELLRWRRGHTETIMQRMLARAQLARETDVLDGFSEARLAAQEDHRLRIIRAELDRPIAAPAESSAAGRAKASSPPRSGAAARSSPAVASPHGSRVAASSAAGRHSSLASAGSQVLGRSLVPTARR